MESPDGPRARRQSDCLPSSTEVKCCAGRSCWILVGANVVGILEGYHRATFGAQPSKREIDDYFWDLEVGNTLELLEELARCVKCAAFDMHDWTYHTRTGHSMEGTLWTRYGGPSDDQLDTMEHMLALVDAAAAGADVLRQQILDIGVYEVATTPKGRRARVPR